MPSSLVKFANRRMGGDKKLFWNRADIDDAPFRGDAPPLMTQEEYDERVVRVKDAKNGFFDVSKPEDNAAYLQVIDAIANGWFQLIYIERFRNQTTVHYVEWVEYYMEDGVTRAPFVNSHIMELANGQGSLPGIVDQNSPRTG